jgi:DNA primase
MFPIRDRDGNCVGFGGRAVGDEQPKYLNSPQTEIFDKSALLYALDRSRDDIRRADKAVVVEGYMDVLAAHQHGYRNVVASMGTAITESQLALLKRYSKNVVLALDADAAGQNAMVRALESLPSAEHDAAPVAGRDLIYFEKRLSVNISILSLPSGKDPDEMIRADADAWEATVDNARPFLAFYLEQITAGVDTSDPRAKDEAVNRAATLLSLMPDGVELRHYVEVLGSRLRMADRRPISDAIRQARKRTTVAAPALPSPPVPRQSKVEDHLVALIVTYPTILDEFAIQLNPDELTDARNRELVLQVAAASAGGNPIATEDDQLHDYGERLTESLSGRAPMNPLEIRREAQRTLEKLRTDQIRHSISELQFDMASAEREKDRETVTLLLGVLNRLAAAKLATPPRKSPVFEDSRDWKSKAVRKRKIVIDV